MATRENNNVTVPLVVGNSTVELPPASPTVLTVSFVLCVWIVVVNSFVVVAFIVWRRRIRNLFTLHLLSLSVGDLLAGVFAIPAILTFVYPARLGYVTCFLSIVPMLMSQVAVMFHILGICFHRLLILFKRTPSRHAARYIIGHVILTWLLTIGFFILLPLLKYNNWMEEEYTGKSCSLNSLFGDSYKSMVKVWVILYFIPLVVTNALYIGMCVKLRHTLRAVHPSVAQISYAGSSGDEQAVVIRGLGGQGSIPAMSDSTESHRRTQKRLFLTISIILLLLDICVVPFVVGFVLEGADVGVKFSRQDKSILVICQLMNSAIDPVVYLLRVHLFRTQLRQARDRWRQRLADCCR